MADPTQFDPQKAASFVLGSGHSGWLGMQYRDHGEDWCELELPWREDLIGETERHVLASGPIISLMDMASGLCIWTKMKSFQAIATLDLRVDYQRPARERHNVIGRAECYRLTRSAAFVRGVAHDGDPDDPVAHIAGVFMALPGMSRDGK
ncbi:PaaI family thioesterase [Parerythrobacter jejuensis]|uniref:Hotdog fold thioesterase n=1 Tax=Parerythrobacter jejuensis TaxID=795812 RepID=A0A845ASK2_9SPHN|nr:PaaI family thioesterase [Parerythrobacter jejuensis]MXP31821.1 hotdog fold thioesterase [Parerythrobacter jejuensis]